MLPLCFKKGHLSSKDGEGQDAIVNGSGKLVLKGLPMQNRLTKILGIQFPLILGPMRMITLGAMAAAVSNSGGLGQIASSTLPVMQLRDEIKKAKDLTDRPFGINIPLHWPNALDVLDIAMETDVRVITTSGGNPARIMNQAKAGGIQVLHKVSTVEMSLKAQGAGVSGVIGMGFEAGGHGGRSQVTTLCLIPRLTDVLDIPVIAAGGIMDYRGFLAALALGAEGVEIGTRFLTSPECNIPRYYKDAVLDSSETGTVVVGDGTMTLRIIKNSAAKFFGNRNREKSDGHRIVDYISGEADSASAIMPAGQGAGLTKTIQPIPEIMAEFIDRSRDLSVKMRQLMEDKG